MIQYDEIEETRKVRISRALTCDLCGKTLDYSNREDRMQLYNFVHIQKEFGYGSDVGDNEEVSIDICEKCFIEKFGIELIKRCTK